MRLVSVQAKAPGGHVIDNQVLVVEVSCTWEHCAVVKICKWSKRKSLKSGDDSRTFPSLPATSLLLHGY